MALFQHFLIEHQDKLLSGEEYHQEGTALQREIEDLEKKVLSFTRESYKVCVELTQEFKPYKIQHLI